MHDIDNARSFLYVFLHVIGITSSSIPGRTLLDVDPRIDQCECGPHVDPRTPAEICATTLEVDKDTTIFCNAGGYFPDLKSGCAKFFTCDAAGKAYKLACGDGAVVCRFPSSGPHILSHRDRV